MVLGKPRQVPHFEVCDERTYSGLDRDMLSYGVVFGVHHLIRPPSRQVEFEYMDRAFMPVLYCLVPESFKIVFII